MTAYVGDGAANIITGDGADDFISGLGGNDTLTGNGGIDYLIGGAGSDKLYGGASDDTFQIGFSETAAGEIYDGGSGIDTLLLTTVSPASAAGMTADFRQSTIASIEKLSFVGNGGHSAYFTGDQIVSGLAANLAVNGGAGTNFFNIYMKNATTMSLGGWTFASWDGADNISIVGTAGNDVVTGSSQTDIFNLGAGKDTVMAGAGNDTIEAGSVVAGEVLDGGTGTDTLSVSQTTTNFTTSSVLGIEKIYFNGTGNGSYRTAIVEADQFSPSGLAFNLVLDGKVGDHNQLTVVMGSQTSINLVNVNVANSALDMKVQFIGSANGDAISGTKLSDTINGNGGNDELTGYDGDDTLNGGLGDDEMRGGNGNDTYFVDSAGDVVNEVSFSADDGAVDLVHATGLDYTLGTYVENLWLHGGNLNGTGNTLANHMTGTDGDNVLKGGAGNDTLIAGKGVDTLYGNSGADTFVFTSILDSAAIAGFRDKILAFQSGADKIDISAIDANTALAGQQDFVLDTNGILDTGEFMIKTAANGVTVVSFNNDAASGIDMQIQFTGTAPVFTDFIL